jgi:hypothetical protein
VARRTPEYRSHTNAGVCRQQASSLLVATSRAPGDRGARTCSVTKRGLPAACAEPGVVTTRQTPAVARPANASAARAGVAEARRDPGVSIEMDELRSSEAAATSSLTRRLDLVHLSSLVPTIRCARVAGEAEAPPLARRL